MTKKKIVLAIIISFSAMALFKFCSWSIIPTYVAWKYSRNEPALKVIPQTLHLPSPGASDEMALSHFGYSFNVPRDKIKQENKIEDIGVRIVFQSGKAIYIENPAKSIRYTEEMLTKASLKNKEKTIQVLGKETLSSDFQFVRAILNTTPDDLSVFVTPAKASRTSILLSLKRLFVMKWVTGMYYFVHDGTKGFQIGFSSDSKGVDLHFFDKDVDRH